MIVLFSTSKGPISAFIRFFTWSKWSHVAILDGDYVIESRGGKGVVRTPLQLFLRRVSRVAAMRYPHVATDAAIAFARSQLGKGYDWGAIFGIGFRRNWGDRSKWSCVELATVAAHAANTPLLRCDEAWRHKPQELWLVPGVPLEIKQLPVAAKVQ